MTVLPPIIINAVVSKERKFSFTESMRFEVFEPISVLVFVEGDVPGFVSMFVVVVNGSSIPEALYESMALKHIDKGM